MAIDRLTCLLCPASCELEAEMTDGDLDVRGSHCEKGVAFAVEEVLDPKRNLATSVPIQGEETRMVSVRLTSPIPRPMIFPVLAAIARLRPARPVHRGDILLRDVCGTGADVLATRSVLN